MKTLLMALLLFLFVPFLVETQDIVEGGTFVPAVTSDYRQPRITVTYSFRLDTSQFEIRDRIQRLLVELRKTNTNGLIAGRLKVYLLERVAEISYAEFIVMVGDNPDDNALIDELLTFLSKREELDDVEIISMSITVEERSR